MTETQEHRDAWEQYKAADVACGEAVRIYGRAGYEARWGDHLAVSEMNAAKIAAEAAEELWPQAWAKLMAAKIPAAVWNAWRGKAIAEAALLSKAAYDADLAVSEEFTKGVKYGPASDKAMVCRERINAAVDAIFLIDGAREASRLAAEGVIT